MFGLPDILKWHHIQESTGQRHENEDLFRDRGGLRLRLFKHSPDSLTVVDDFPRVIIEARSKFGEGLQLGELGVGEFEIACHAAVCRTLSLPADA